MQCLCNLLKKCFCVKKYDDMNNTIIEQPKIITISKIFNNLYKYKLCLLELEDSKYYVSFDENINELLNDKNINEWIEIHRPIKISYSILLSNNIDLDDYVLKFMNKYGINNVRGGSYKDVILDNDTIKFIKYEIRRRTNKCIRCGKTHNYLQCNSKYDTDNEIITLEPINEQSTIYNCDICNSIYYDYYIYHKCVSICLNRIKYFQENSSGILNKEPWKHRINLD